MKCLVVVAHPLTPSLCQTLSRAAVDALAGAGHEVQVLNLYRAGFAPALDEAERISYYQPHFARDKVRDEVDQLEAAEAIVLVFPTWWFSFPAILKGWFDRVWAPGVAYDHASDLGSIRPRLTNLRHLLAVTTLGSPWWVDRLILRQPVRRVLKTALLGACAPACRFEMLTLYKAEDLSTPTVDRFATRVRKAMLLW